MRNPRGRALFMGAAGQGRQHRRQTSDEGRIHEEVAERPPICRRLLELELGGGVVLRSVTECIPTLPTFRVSLYNMYIVQCSEAPRAAAGSFNFYFSPHRHGTSCPSRGEDEATCVQMSRCVEKD